MPIKEKILSLPSEYITIGLAAIFVISVFLGILFISSQTASSPIQSSLPQASGDSALSATDLKPSEVPRVLASKAPLGPSAPSIKSKPTPSPTPKPTPTPSINSTATPNPTPTSTPSSAKVVNLTMDPSTTTTQVNQTFSVALKMDAGSDQVTGVELHIDFDHTKLQIESFTAGTFMQVLTPESHDNSNGTASIVLGAAPSAPVSGSGTLATINFKAVATGNNTVSYNSSTQTASKGRSDSSLNSSSGDTVTIN